MRTIIDRIGGRKFSAWLVATLSLVVLAVTGTEVDPDILATIQTILIAFMGGNAAEHLSGLLRGRDASEGTAPSLPPAE